MMISKELAAMAARRKALLIKSRGEMSDDERAAVINEMKTVHQAIRMASRNKPTEFAYGMAYGASALPVDGE